MRTLKGPEDARRQVQYWTDEGATSLKTYMQITRGELAAAVNEAHRRGIKVTGHLCSVTYAEAAGLGIDNLEHGFFAATDFVADKKPDVCPGQGVGQKTIAALDENGAPFKALVKTLIDEKVALTSTLTVFETFTPGRPKPPGLEVLTPQLREQFEQNYARTAQNKDSIYTTLFPKGMALERAFAKAGGLLIAGTDPTGGGGVIPGFANQRQVELFVDAGFTPLEAISISTLNGAKYLGRDARVGSLAVGKQADLVVIDGNPAATIADIRKVETVFKQGIGYDPVKLIASVTGKAGSGRYRCEYAQSCLADSSFAYPAVDHYRRRRSTDRRAGRHRRRPSPRASRSCAPRCRSGARSIPATRATTTATPRARCSRPAHAATTSAIRWTTR